MGVSKLIDALGTAVVEKTVSNFAKVFRRKRGSTIEYLWYTTDANGNKLARGGQVKGTEVYSSLAAAEAAIPVGYTLVTDGGGGGTVDGDFVVQFTKGITGDSSYQYDYPDHITSGGQVDRRLSITVTSNYRLQVTINTIGMADSESNMRFKTDADNTISFSNWLTKAELEAKDFSALKGRDLMVVMGHIPSGAPYPYLIYTLVHLAGDSTTNLPQYIKRADASIRMPQFVYNFPNISPLSTRVNIMQFQQLDNSLTNVSYNYLNKGYNIGTSNNQSKQFVGIYDDWCYENGGLRKENYAAWAAANPSQAAIYTSYQKYNVHWVESRTIQELYSYFNNAVIAPNAGKGFLFMDWEFVGFEGLGSQDFCNKIGTLFRAFKVANPNCLLTSYVNADPAKVVFDANLIAGDVTTYNNKYNQSFSQIATGFYAKTVQYLNVNTGAFTGETGNMGQYLEPVVNAYMHYVNVDNLYSIIQELEITAKAGFKSLTFNWGLNEGISGSDWEAYHKYFKTSDGFNYRHEVKIPTPAPYMFNCILASNLIGHGAWIWDEPLPFMEGFDYWGSNSRDITDSYYLGQKFSTNNGSLHYAAQTAYDAATWAIYRIIHNKDIVENNQPITMPEYSIDGGSTYKSGNDLLPASAEYNRLPIVRLKKHDTLPEYVVFAVNHHLKSWETQQVRVKVADKVITLILKGQWAEFERVK